MEVQEEVEQVANDGGEDGDPEWPICCFSYFVLFCVGLSGSRFLVKCFLQLELKPSQFLYIKLLAVLPSFNTAASWVFKFFGLLIDLAFLIFIVSDRFSFDQGLGKLIHQARLEY